MTHLHADAGNFRGRVQKHARVLRRDVPQPVLARQIRLERPLHPADVVSDPHGRRRPGEIEEGVSHELARSVVRQLTAARGLHEVCADPGKARAFFCELVCGLAAPRCVDGSVLEEQKKVVVG